MTPPAGGTTGGEWRAGLVERYSVVRRFLPVFCRVIEFGATADAAPILAALQGLPDLMAGRATKRVPVGYLDAEAIDPTVIPAGWWQPLVFPTDRPPGTVDRAAYVFCVLEICNAPTDAFAATSLAGAWW